MNKFNKKSKFQKLVKNTHFQIIVIFSFLITLLSFAIYPIDSNSTNINLILGINLASWPPMIIYLITDKKAKNNEKNQNKRLVEKKFKILQTLFILIHQISDTVDKNHDYNKTLNSTFSLSSPRKLDSLSGFERETILSNFEIFEKLFTINFSKLDLEEVNYSYTSFFNLIPTVKEFFKEDPTQSIWLESVILGLHDGVIHVMAHTTDLREKFLEIYPEYTDEFKKINKTDRPIDIKLSRYRL